MTQARDLADLAGAADAGTITGRNIVINGNMSIAQRGTSSTGSGIGCVDRFTHAYSGGTVTSSQESLTSSDTPYSLGIRNYIRMTNDANTTAANAQRQIYQNIEAQYLAKSGWDYTSTSSYVTVSFWVRSSLAGKYGAYLLTYDGTAQSFSFTYTLSANTWTKVTKTIPGNSSLTFDNDNGLGMSLVVYSWLGTDYTDSTATIDAWVTNDNTKYFKEDLADWGGTTSATLDVTAVQFEVGTTATDFEREDLTITLKKCERYYELVGTAVYVGATSYGFAGTEYIVNSNWFEIDWKTEKRTDSVVVDFINGFGWSSSPANSGAGRYGAMWYKGTSFIAQVAGNKTGLPIASVSAEV